MQGVPRHRIGERWHASLTSLTVPQAVASLARLIRLPQVYLVENNSRSGACPSCWKPNRRSKVSLSCSEGAQLRVSMLVVSLRCVLVQIRSMAARLGWLGCVCDTLVSLLAVDTQRARDLISPMNPFHAVVESALKHPNRGARRRCWPGSALRRVHVGAKGSDEGETRTPHFVKLVQTSPPREISEAYDPNDNSMVWFILPGTRCKCKHMLYSSTKRKTMLCGSLYHS